MHSYTGQDVLDVFTDASGKPVKYPRLTTLELSNGHQLKYCDVVSEFKKDGLATVGMLLAVMCPSMTRFMSNSRSRMVIQEMINKAIKEEPFSRHAGKLKLLTYNGVPEGSKTFPVKQVYW
ncbi:hypothetical protein GGI10_004578 [Coemansia sp. RSA 2530]|nr:hypothetical protein GGI10_004578 [Coemansia sp. RSA 2530]